jgi:triosephosphate isomerase
MLVEAGAKVVIVGHSERRADQAETSQDAWAKAAAAHRHGLNVILCCGETEAERDAGRAERIVQSQIEKSLPDGAASDWLTIAYEPRWAIGTGKTPSLDEIATMHAIIRAKLRGMIGTAAEGIRILYGGSVSGANAEDCFAGGGRRRRAGRRRQPEGGRLPRHRRGLSLIPPGQALYNLKHTAAGLRQCVAA